MKPRPPAKIRAIPKREDSNTDRYTFTIPKNLYAAFKKACKAQDASMSYVITTWIREFLEEE